MQQTRQQLAIAAAQTVCNLMAQLSATHDAVNAFLIKNTNQSYDTQWQALPTAVFATDGTVGVADGSPVNTHPINVPAAPATPLLVARNDLLTALGCLANFQSYMNGVAITTQTNTPRKYADLLNS